MVRNVTLNSTDLQRAIRQELRNMIAKRIPKIEHQLNTRLTKLLEKHFLNGLPVISGRDYYELGIPDIQDRLTSIALSAASDFKIKIFQNNLLNINLGILDTSYKDLIELPESLFTATGKRGVNILPWLAWLVKSGSTPVIADYDFMVKENAGRTQGGIMIRTNNWSVPESLQGTPDDNLLTRCLEDINHDIVNMVETVLKQVLS